MGEARACIGIARLRGSSLLAEAHFVIPSRSSMQDARRRAICLGLASGEQTADGAVSTM